MYDKLWAWSSNTRSSGGHPRICSLFRLNLSKTHKRKKVKERGRWRKLKELEVRVLIRTSKVVRLSGNDVQKLLGGQGVVGEFAFLCPIAFPSILSKLRPLSLQYLCDASYTQVNPIFWTERFDLTAAAFLDEIGVAKPGHAMCDCCCPVGASSAASCAQSDLITNIRRVCSNNTSFRACGVPSSQSLPALAAPSIPL